MSRKLILSIVVGVVAGVVMVSARTAVLYRWQVQRASALPADIVTSTGRLEIAPGAP